MRISSTTFIRFKGICFMLLGIAILAGLYGNYSLAYLVLIALLLCGIGCVIWSYR